MGVTGKFHGPGMWYNGDHWDEGYKRVRGHFFTQKSVESKKTVNMECQKRNGGKIIAGSQFILFFL